MTSPGFALDPLNAPVSALVPGTGTQLVPQGTVIKKGAVKATHDGIFWECPSCQSENSMEEAMCPVCGKTLTEAMRPPEKDRPQRDPGKVALISLFLPGAGHAYLGDWGQATARAVLSLWVMSVVVITLVSGGPGRFIAAVFGLAALLLWVVTAHDAYREATRETSQVILRGRRLMWVTLGLLALLMMMVFASASRATLDNPEVPEIESDLPT